jgi:hypothetical protein
VNTAFKHLEAKLRFGDLSIGQWAGVVAGILCGLAVAQLLHPLGGMWSLVIGVYVGAIPAFVAVFAGLGEFDLWRLLAGMRRWRTSEGRHLPGPGRTAHGYAVLATAAAEPTGAAAGGTVVLDVLWPTHPDDPQPRETP